MRFVWDLLVVNDADMISLLEELPTLLPTFFGFFLPFALKISNDILSSERDEKTEYTFIYTILRFWILYFMYFGVSYTRR